jgi:hypothetical protein
MQFDNGKELKWYTLPIPAPKVEQVIVCDPIRILRHGIIRERPLLAKLQELKIGLLQDLLMGTVQVKADGPKEGITHA